MASVRLLCQSAIRVKDFIVGVNVASAGSAPGVETIMLLKGSLIKRGSPESKKQVEGQMAGC